MEKKICRLCCKNEATLNIFYENNSRINLCKKIAYCCPNIIVKDGDGFPSSICDNCDEELEHCYQFILKCEAADKQLHSQTLLIPTNIIDELNNSCEEPVIIKSELKCVSDNEHTYEDHHSDDIPLDTLRTNKSAIQYSKSEQSVTSKCKLKNKYKESQVTKCSVCGRQCMNHSSLKAHMRSHTNIYSFHCSSCDKKYKDGGSLKRHIERHHSQCKRLRNFICESCGKRFFTKHDIKIHMRTHTGETPYACSECPLRFTQLGALLRHQKRHTGEKDHMCSVCPKRFCTKEELKMHYAVHSTEKKYKCPLCKSSFKQQTNLTKHVRLHSEDQGFICNYCGRNFKFKGNLKLHIVKQHSEKSGYCKQCSRHVPNLQEHSWKHTGERPLKCNLCSSSFYESRGLAHHINFKHTKTDRFKCDYKGCLKSFPSRPMLDFHIAKLHGTHIPFPCDRCSRAFYRKNDLSRHKKGTHKE